MSEQVRNIMPELGKSAFQCPRCHTYAKHEWWSVATVKSVTSPHGYQDLLGSRVYGLQVAYCAQCMVQYAGFTDGTVKMYTVWHEKQMIYPATVNVTPPNPDLLDEIKQDYREAAAIVNKSPRGAAALLRLCIQKLCKQLGEKGKDLNVDIGNMVKKGLPSEIQQALDIVRVTGNNAVHPGQLDFEDDENLAMGLFRLVNRIADVMITQPRLTRELYDDLPQTAKDQIQKRDQSQKPK